MPSSPRSSRHRPVALSHASPPSVYLFAAARNSPQPWGFIFPTLFRPSHKSPGMSLVSWHGNVFYFTIHISVRCPRLSVPVPCCLFLVSTTQRRLRVVRIDASKSSLLLDLPNGPPPLPTATQATVFLLKEAEDEGSGGSGTAAVREEGTEGTGAAAGKQVIATLIASGLSDPAETSSVIAASLASAEPMPVGFSPLVKRPSLRPKRQPPSSSARTPSTSPRDEPASKTLTDAELKSARLTRQSAEPPPPPPCPVL